MSTTGVTDDQLDAGGSTTQANIVTVTASASATPHSRNMTGYTGGQLAGVGVGVGIPLAIAVGVLSYLLVREKKRIRQSLSPYDRLQQSNETSKEAQTWPTWTTGAGQVHSPGQVSELDNEGVQELGSQPRSELDHNVYNWRR